MTHYLTYVMIEESDIPQVHRVIEKLMASFSCEVPGDGHWDWYQIGGRWTGHFSDYDPEKDPANIETCRRCQGTGKIDPNFKCNGCHGKGKSIKWPTEWKSPLEVNMTATNELSAEDLCSCYALLDAHGKWHEIMAVGSHPDFPGWPYKNEAVRPAFEALRKRISDEWKNELVRTIAACASPTTYLVAVDCHI